ncbi:Battenin [Echinococcus granulosus]|uniref:Battenin n=1 Tax=Echinococcus granulosus TaxID=6210 RepID=W6U3W7_ECHGR|nr:Battenin [Echinococcus granulosus]EUB55286.1 Battenin [Echinococcus granulosus]KAH9278608.1 Battenin [Echinococcus granulosus]
MGLARVREFWQIWRNYIAFWCFGLFNNFIYVVMLSAAVDILESGTSKKSVYDTDWHGRVNCTVVGTGAVLLADIGPSLLLKLLAPVFIQRLHFHFKVRLSVFFALSAFLIVSFSNSTELSLFGVVCASLSCGLGDVTFLTMVAFFDTGVLASWSSGSGAAGIVGALAYAALTSIFSPQVTLLAITFVPLAMLFMYFLVLEKPSTPAFQVSHSSSSWWFLGCPLTCLPTAPPHVGADAREPTYDDSEGNETHQLIGHANAAQVSPDWGTRKRIIWAIFPFIFPLMLVYFFEYLINQSLYELIYFNGLGISHSQQYRWFQVVYQCGVFASRSSLKFCRVKEIWALAVLQGLMFVLFLAQAISPFTNNIGAFCGIIFFEGSLGGLAYVNAFDRVLRAAKADTREYSMSVAAFSDSLGITCAAFVAIPLHNWLCRLIAPKPT